MTKTCDAKPQELSKTFVEQVTDAPPAESPADKATAPPAESPADTIREYFEDTFRTESVAKVVRVDSSPDYKKVPDAIDVQLDRTIFYPQGGGQPSDTGTIKAGDRVFKVLFVQAGSHTGGVIHHYGTFEGEPFAEGAEVTLSVEAEKRVIHAKLHTMGHLLDVAMIQCGYGHFPLGKGYHFPESSYDEYTGSIPPAQRKPAMAKLQAAMDKLIAADIPLVKTMADGVQHVRFGEEGQYPPSQNCGGTHLNSTGQIGKFIIRKIKVKKGMTRIYKSLV